MAHKGLFRMQLLNLVDPFFPLHVGILLKLSALLVKLSLGSSCCLSNPTYMRKHRKVGLSEVSSGSV